MSPSLAPSLHDPIALDLGATFAPERSLSRRLAVAPIAASPSRASVLLDYIELTKPKIAILELATIAVAAWLAGAGRLSVAVAHALAGTTLVAASASVFNQWIERERDRHMRRTADRPLPAGRLADRDVFCFGLATGAIGLVWLAVFVGAATAGFGLLAWFVYVAIYTPLKRLTTLNTAVGAVAGALPVAIGWSAAGGGWSWTAAGLFGLVFAWQFPHFMAIAWMYRRDYEAAGFKMLPVVDPSGRKAGQQALAFAAVLVFAAPWLALASGAGTAVAVWSLLLGIGQLACATRFARQLDDGSARLLLRASLAYLPAVLAGFLLASGGSFALPPT